MIKVTVIIPVFNTDKYLKKCLDSVLYQTLSDIEIIIIDDGSIDLSSKICDEYNIYSNIKIIHQMNKGLSASRNLGIQLASGEFIGFVDSDDYIDLSMYEVLYNTSKIKSNIDVVSCGYYVVNDSGRIINKSSLKFPVNIIIPNYKIREYCNKLNINSDLWLSQKSIYRRSMIQKYNIKFIEKNIIEDSPFNLTAYLYSRSMICLDNSLYYYVQSQDSIMRKKYKHNYLEKLENLYNEKIKIYSRFGIDGYEENLKSYTMSHTINLLIVNEINNPNGIQNKIKSLCAIRNSKMIKNILNHVILKLNILEYQ